MSKKKQGFIESYLIKPTHYFRSAFGFIPHAIPFAKQQQQDFKKWSETAQKRLKNPAESNFKLGLEFYDKNKANDAITRFTLSCIINPKSAKSYLWLGKSYLLKNNFEKAIANFEKAHSLKLQDPELEYFLSIYLKDDFKTKASKDIKLRFFNKFIPVFNDFYIENFNYSAHQKIADLFLNHNEKTSANILELGCGSGHLAKILKINKNDLSIEGLDFSESAIEICKNLEYQKTIKETNQKTINLKNQEEDDPNILEPVYDKLHMSDIETFKIEPSKKYDAVIARGIFNYIEDLNKILENFKKHTKKGALLIFNINQEQSDNIKSDHLHNYSFPFYLNSISHNLDEIKKICTKHSFNLETSQNFDIDNQNSAATILVFKHK